MRVLIVDDNDTNRRILEDQMQVWGIRAACAAGAQEALEKLQDPPRRASMLFCLTCTCPA
jgi:CheY-like chemotaxis protein